MRYLLSLFQGGNTPLHLAAMNGHVDVIDYLVRERRAAVEPELIVSINHNYAYMVYRVY